MVMQAPDADRPPRIAIDFAEAVADGFPPTPAKAQACTDAHDQIDRRCLDIGTVDGYARMCRLLYGGDTGRDHCAAMLADQPVRSSEPIAADLDDETSEFHDLCVKLNRIDDRVSDRIEAAARLAYLSALRALTRQARGAVMASMSKAWRDDVGQDIVDARGASRVLYKQVNTSPYVADRLIPDAVFAELTLDQEQAISDAIEDLGFTADEIIRDGHRDVVVTLAEELDITEEEVRVQLAELMDEQRSSAVGLLVGSMLAFTLSRADRTDGEVTLGLEEAVVPASIVADTVAVAGGGVRTANTVARTADGALELVTGGATDTATVSGGWLDAVFQRVTGVPLRTTYEWHYGSPSDRERPREDHQRLDGLQWTTADERQAALADASEIALVADDVAPDVWPGSLPGCKCTARPVELGLSQRVR